jgi:hypothetical protein
MSSQQGLGRGVPRPAPARPQPRANARTIARNARRAVTSGLQGRAYGMDLERITKVSLTTLDGSPRTGREVVRQRTVLMLIDAHRTRPDRSAAEIAWVQERLEPGIDLIVIWPRGAQLQATAIDTLDHARMYLDAHGEFRRLVSPSGKRVAILVDPLQGTIERLGAESDVFAVGRGESGDERGSDRTMDLGDVYR